MKVSQVTLATIAEAAGVHKMTVSRALRNHPSISPATRERVQRIAKKLGYRPNPLLSIYQAHVRARKAPAYQATLAWINDNPSQNYWVATPYNRPYLDGVRARAEQLGYRIDELWLEDLDREHPENNIERFIRVMRARGIHGAILAPQVTKRHAILPWSGIAVATIGRHHLPYPPEEHTDAPLREVYHLASFDSFANMQTACENLRRLGYRRIALTLSEWHDRISDWGYRGAYLAEQWEWPRTERLPMFIERGNWLEDTPPAGFEEWLARCKPDVVICAKSQVYQWLQRLGYRIPQDIGLVHLFVEPDVAGWSGVNPQIEEVGAAAVDLVVGQLQRNESGIPAVQREVLIKGFWVEGHTTRPQ